MDFETVKAWLAEQAEQKAKWCRSKGVLGMVLCPVALAVVLTVVYWLLRLFMHDPAGNLGDTKACLWMTLALIPVMFIGNRLSPRRDLMEERMSGDAIDTLVDRFSPRRRSEVVGLLFLWILFTGPRLLDWGIASFREARRWREMDTHSCAAVLWLLAARYKKVPYEDFQSELPWLDLPATLAELERVPGILRLQTPPPGLGLTDDLRKAIRTGGPIEE